jgi:hypothetical protein
MLQHGLSSATLTFKLFVGKPLPPCSHCIFSTHAHCKTNEGTKERTSFDLARAYFIRNVKRLSN